MKRIILPFCVTGLFWVIVAMPWGEGGGGRRTRAVQFVSEGLEWLLMRPLSLPGAIAFVFFITLFFTILFEPSKRQFEH